MRKWIWATVVAALLLAAYVAAGPWLTLRAIAAAVERDDARALARQVDFPPLRASLKRQIGDRMLREAGVEAQSSLLGAIGLRLAGGLVSGAVDVAVTPVGLAALMQGREAWRAFGERPAADVPAPAHASLRAAEHRYESLSRFTATVRVDDGDTLVFVLTRRGIRWRLSDIRLP